MAFYRLLYSLLLSLALVLPAATASAQSFEDGLRALRDDQAPRAEEIWLALAQQGDGQAQYALGTLYEQGYPGVDQDLAKAIIWYEKSAAQGVASAENNLALIHATGRGVERDPATALRLWLSAANKGHVQAQYNAGLAFFRGSGVERDIGRASQLFQKAAAGGLADSQYALAQMYRLGIGVPRNARTSLFWYEQAAAQGHSSSQREAQELREAGIVLDDDTEAATTVASATETAPAQPKPAAAATQSAQQQAAKPAAQAQEQPAPAQAAAATQSQAQAKPAEEPQAATATQQAARPSATTSTPTSGYGLWIGSANDNKAAQRIWGELHGRGFPALAEKAYRIEEPQQGSDLRRVYATAWPDRAAAVSACLAIKEADPAIFCAPVALK